MFEVPELWQPDRRLISPLGASQRYFAGPWWGMRECCDDGNTCSIWSGSRPSTISFSATGAAWPECSGCYRLNRTNVVCSYTNHADGTDYCSDYYAASLTDGAVSVRFTHFFSSHPDYPNQRRITVQQSVGTVYTDYGGCPDGTIIYQILQVSAGTSPLSSSTTYSLPLSFTLNVLVGGRWEPACDGTMEGEVTT